MSKSLVIVLVLMLNSACSAEIEDLQISSEKIFDRDEPYVVLPKDSKRRLIDLLEKAQLRADRTPLKDRSKIIKTFYFLKYKENGKWFETSITRDFKFASRRFLLEGEEKKIVKEIFDTALKRSK